MSSTIPQFKTCSKCGQSKPITEFYRHPATSDKYDSTCRACKKAYKQQYTTYQKHEAHPTEQLAIDKLRSLGIYAINGKCSEFRYTDVVVWGCVKIEVKYSNLTQSGQYHFGFQKSQIAHPKSDLVMLICNGTIGQTFHIFPRNHPIFYFKDGRHKNAVVWFPNAKDRKPPRGSICTLTDELMQQYQNKWELIEICRQRISEGLYKGTYSPMDIVFDPKDVLF